MATETYRYKRGEPITKNLVGWRGDTLKSEKYTLTATDLTGATVSLKAIIDGASVDLSEYVTVDAPNGSFYVKIPPSVTNGTTPWGVGLGTYDITVTDTAGDVYTYITGKIGLNEAAHV